MVRLCCVVAWQAEIAGTKSISDWEATARVITGVSGGQASVFEDAATGQTRIAVTQDGMLAALLFVGPQPVALARQHAVSLIGTDITGLAALAGHPTGDMPDPGAVVCSCFGVGINTLRAAILNGATSIEALGTATCAGTNCGSCKPELAALIATQSLPLAAE